MPLFSKPQVSPREMRGVKWHLKDQGFSRNDMKNVKNVLSGYMGNSDWSKGVDKNEAGRAIKYLRENMSKHTLSKDQVDTLEKTLNKEI